MDCCVFDYWKIFLNFWWCHVSLFFHVSGSFALHFLHLKLLSSSLIFMSCLQEKKNPFVIPNTDSEPFCLALCGYTCSRLLVPSWAEFWSLYVFSVSSDVPCQMPICLSYFPTAQICGFFFTHRLSACFLCVFPLFQSFLLGPCKGSQ